MEIEVDPEEIKLNPKLIFNCIIFISLGIILTFSYIVISEILTAKKECEKSGGNYQLKNFNHLCNNQSFQKYSDGNWRYEQKPINLSDIIK